MRAEIVSVGTELLLGSITDTNAAYLAQRLAAIGIDCHYISQVGDNPGRLLDVLRHAWERSDLTITTGGLGPTPDDLTREAIAALLGETPVVDPQMRMQLREFFARRGVPMPAGNEKQATLIPSCEPLNNPVGTAPGWWVYRASKSGPRIIVAMPGVPFEMYRMWEMEVEPRLRSHSDAVIVSRTLKVIGRGESAVADLLTDLMNSSNPTLAPYAKQDGVHLRLTAKAQDEESAKLIIAPLEAEIRRRLGDAIYGTNGDTLEHVAHKLLQALNMKCVVLEIGPGAMGSITSRLGGLPFFNGAISAPTLGTLTSLAMPSGQKSISSLIAAALDVSTSSEADLVLAVQGTVRPVPKQLGAVAAHARVVVVSPAPNTSGHPYQVRQTEHRWNTSAGEVPRLVGLAALDALRQALLSIERMSR